jgi:esterase/lipase
MPSITVPYLGIGGLQDELVPVEQAELIYKNIGSSDKNSKMFENYGHVDLLIGKNDSTEIFLKIAEWLNARAFFYY